MENLSSSFIKSKSSKNNGRGYDRATLKVWGLEANFNLF